MNKSENYIFVKLADFEKWVIENPEYKDAKMELNADNMVQIAKKKPVQRSKFSDKLEKKDPKMDIIIDEKQVGTWRIAVKKKNADGKRFYRFTRNRDGKLVINECLKCYTGSVEF